MCISRLKIVLPSLYFALLLGCSDSLVTPFDIEPYLGQLPYQVEAILTPNDSSRIYITQTTPIGVEVTPEFVNNAFITVSLNGQVVDTADYHQESLYILPAKELSSISYYSIDLSRNSVQSGDSVVLNISISGAPLIRCADVVPYAVSEADIRRTPSPDVSYYFTYFVSVSEGTAPEPYLFRGWSRGTRNSKSIDDPSGPRVNFPVVSQVKFTSGNLIDPEPFNAFYTFQSSPINGFNFIFEGLSGSTSPRAPSTSEFCLYRLNDSGYEYLEATKTANRLTQGQFLQVSEIPTNIENAIGGFVLTSAPYCVELANPE